MLIAVMAFPSFVSWQHAHLATPFEPQPFIVSVNPADKTIADTPALEAQLFNARLSLAAVSAGTADVFAGIAGVVAAQPWYQLAATIGLPKAVEIRPGMRREQVAAAFGSALGWDKAGRAAFLSSTTTPLTEGAYFPSTYLVLPGMGQEEVLQMVRERFDARILSRYATSTRDVVPVIDALTIASLLEREAAAGDSEEMRVISGIIWNRLFAGMRLQIDATLQYTRGTSSNGWWPVPRARDKYIKSDYNTYMHEGLPPGPINSPSVAAVIATLNPKKTDCLFYFHDKKGDFHCTASYEEHVALLKQYYGRGR